MANTVKSEAGAVISARVQATGRTMERMSESLRGIHTRIIALNRWADTLEP